MSVVNIAFSMAPGPALITLVSSAELLVSWQWLKGAVTARPTRCAAGTNHLRDNKLFSCGTPAGPLAIAKGTPESLALGRLYLASLMAPTKAINEMATGGVPPEVRTAKPFDNQIYAVLKKPARFRAGLAEHLAFWVRLRDTIPRAPGEKCALARPNVQPEDKGHDGLCLKIATKSMAELQSVKNATTTKARQLVSTSKFRKKGIATSGALLDDFWLFQNENVGLHRLEHMLSDVTNSLGLTPDALATQAVIADCAFNGVVVADATQGKPDLFVGYEHIQQVPEGRVATFVGAQTWTATAAAVQDATLNLLNAKGAV